jgi:hypothetical protein
VDVRRVVETGIQPLINTGIAHREAGVGQVGAGLVRAPIEPFIAAFEHMTGLDTRIGPLRRSAPPPPRGGREVP